MLGATETSVVWPLACLIKDYICKISQDRSVMNSDNIGFSTVIFCATGSKFGFPVRNTAGGGIVISADACRTGLTNYSIHLVAPLCIPELLLVVSNTMAMICTSSIPHPLITLRRLLVHVLWHPIPSLDLLRTGMLFKMERSPLLHLHPGKNNLVILIIQCKTTWLFSIY